MESESRTSSFLLNTVQVAALWNLAVAQPIYDLLGRSPEFFAVRGSRSSDVLAWILCLSVAMPLVLGALVAAAGAFHRALGRLVHLCVVAVLVGMLILLATQRLGWPTFALVAMAVLFGILGAFAVGRYRIVRQYLALLAVGAIVFPVLFLSRSSVLRATSRGSMETLTMPLVQADTPVVMVVFDELPTVSLLDANRKIDPTRYPNFASLAEQATWFRYGATVSEFTTTAVPALLTGLYPEPGRQPTAADHPFNLFTLLGPSFELSVVESMSHLCPENLCEASAASLAHRLASLYSDISIAYAHLVLPEAWRGYLPPVDQTWMAFGADERIDETERSKKIKDSYWLDIFRERAYGDRAAHLLDYLSEISGSGRRRLYFYNSFLPHVPYDYLPSGHLYSTDREVKGRVVGEQWGGDEWAVSQSYQRHLLQVGFVDRQLGQVIKRLRDAGLLDSCLLIVTADHGASHRPQDSRRKLTETNFAEIIPVPLLVKLPHQERGQIDDRVAQTIDVLPTIAEVLGVDLPWAVDGLSLLGPEVKTRDTYRVFRKDETEPVLFKAERLRDGLDQALRTKLSVFGSGAEPEERFYQVGTYGRLVGRRVADLPVGDARDIECEISPGSHLGSYDPDSGFVPSHIRGRARAARPGRPVDLAVAINGTIRAVTRTWSFSTNRGWDEWSAVVNERSFRPGKNQLEVFHIRPDGSRVELERTSSRILSPAAGTAPLGVEPIHGISESGFYRPERFEDIPARWTDGHARLEIPFDTDRPPRALRVDLLWTGPFGTHLEVLINGEVRFEGDVPAGRWSSKFTLDQEPASRVELELKSDTFVPKDTVEGGKDARSLGVAVGGIWLLDD